MKRIRSLFGLGGGEEAPPDSTTSDAAQEPAEDEAARELRLQREFYTSRSEIARHELRFQEYAPEAPSQVNRSGRWVVAELTDALDDAGRAIVLEVESELDYVGVRGDNNSGLRFRFRTSDGHEVEIAAPPGQDWPASIVRPSELGSPRET
jgi:hypothetical protein